MLGVDVLRSFEDYENSYKVIGQFLVGFLKELVGFHGRFTVKGDCRVKGREQRNVST